MKISGIALLCAVAVIVSQVSAFAPRPADDSWQSNSKAHATTTSPDCTTAWASNNAPGKQHAKLLGNILGTWRTQTKFFTDSAGNYDASEGTATIGHVLAGRFCEMKFSGNMMGAPFESVSLYGYNNATEQYESCWMDNGTTGMTISYGVPQHDNAVLFTSEFIDPDTNEKKTTQTLLTITNRDAFSYEMFVVEANGSKARAFEIGFTRSNAAQSGAPQRSSVNAGQCLSHEQQSRISSEKASMAIKGRIKQQLVNEQWRQVEASAAERIQRQAAQAAPQEWNSNEQPVAEENTDEQANADESEDDGN